MVHMNDVWSHTFKYAKTAKILKEIAKIERVQTVIGVWFSFRVSVARTEMIKTEKKSFLTEKEFLGLNLYLKK